MVRTRNGRTDDQAPEPPARATRGQCRGRGRPRGAAGAPARSASEEPPAAPAGGPAPEIPIATPALQEALAQFLSMFSTLAQAGLFPIAPATSQAGGGAQTPAAHTPEQRVQVDQAPEYIPMPPVAPVQHEIMVAAFEAEQLRLERYKKYHPLTFSGLASDDALGFLEECHHILRTMGIVETSGVSFTAFQLRGAAYQWWRAYELSSSDEAASLTWTHFSEMFLREYVPQSLRDAWRAEFEQLRQGSMTVSEYAVHFSRLARHAPALVATVKERVRRFIEGLHPSIRTSMARELEMDITYQQAVSIARRVEGMFARDREEREAKRSRETGNYSGARAPAACYGRGFVSRPVYSALPAASGVPAPPRPQEPYYAPPNIQYASYARCYYRPVQQDRSESVSAAASSERLF
ncbi:uncharacterized protein [Nicotiana tomentosiformis]|uniref:uncharacterized protein n=1 Tax=Nicotiana tomentosiformis TaxID=4098 RepID=UPI00388CA873